MAAACGVGTAALDCRAVEGNSRFCCFLFPSHQAELMKANLEKAIKEWKGERESQDMLR